jgi:hypothetical protein
VTFGMAYFVKMKIMNEGHKVNHSEHIIMFGKFEGKRTFGRYVYVRIILK